MKRPWIAAYPPGVPHTIDAARYPSLVAMVAESCARFRDRPAFRSMGVELTYADVERLSGHFAAYLRREGLGPGDRVAIMLPNVLQYPVTLLGALRAGAAVVNVNPLYTASELALQLDDSGARAIVVLEQFAATLERALPGTAVTRTIVTGFGDLYPAVKRHAANWIAHRRNPVRPWHIPDALTLREALARGRGAPAREAAVRPEDVAFVQYTGGTTGRPKGVVLTHRNVVANVEQIVAWMNGMLAEGRETVATPLPLYHIFALTANLFLFLRLGGNNVLIADPRDLRRLLATLAASRCTAMTGVNTLFKALVESPEFAPVAERARGVLKLAVAGGMALERGVAERWQSLTGITIVEGYGLTEAAPVVCGNPYDVREYTGKIGLPLPSTDVAILDDHGAPAPFGAEGEIAVRGPQVMREYWLAPEETRRAFTADGWLLTGDMGWMDEHGCVQFVERRKEVIVVSGFKAYPAEIEAVARLHPGVSDAAAVGLPDPHSGETVALAVVRRDAALTEHALLAHCGEHLARYKRPHRVRFVERLPRSPIGKTLRRAVRQMLLDEMRASDAADAAVH